MIVVMKHVYALIFLLDTQQQLGLHHHHFALLSINSLRALKSLLGGKEY